VKFVAIILSIGSEANFGINEMIISLAIIEDAVRTRQSKKNDFFMVDKC
jgi:hypothetical protein